jgi:hypothetical protein
VIALVAIGALGSTMGAQITQLAEELPIGGPLSQESKQKDDWYRNTEQP